MFTRPPFTRDSQLCPDLDDEILSPANHQGKAPKRLPGRPRIQLDNQADVITCLEQECLAPDLEHIAPHLWILSTQSSAHIHPLHRQKVKGREIIVAEDPRLHLVWIHDRIFIKPIPRFLLSYAFWDEVLLRHDSTCSERLSAIRAAALGYLRSYRYLIQYEIDLRIAQRDDLRLVPSGIDWPKFCNFLADLEYIEDSDVSGRYQYGELRLSRLNFYAPLLLRKLYFEKLYGQYSDIFGRFFGVMLFGFAIASTLLSAMQVEMAVEQLIDKRWTTFWLFARWSSILMLTGVSLVSSGVCLFWMWMIADEWIFALKCRRAKRIHRASSACNQ